MYGGRCPGLRLKWVLLALLHTICVVLGNLFTCSYSSWRILTDSKPDFCTEHFSWSQSLRLRRCTCWRCVTSSPTYLLHLELECSQEKVSRLSVREGYPCDEHTAEDCGSAQGTLLHVAIQGPRLLSLRDSVNSQLLITICNWLPERETAWRTTQEVVTG